MCVMCPAIEETGGGSEMIFNGRWHRAAGLLQGFGLFMVAVLCHFLYLVLIVPIKTLDVLLGALGMEG